MQQINQLLHSIISFQPLCLFFLPYKYFHGSNQYQLFYALSFHPEYLALDTFFNLRINNCILIGAILFICINIIYNKHMIGSKKKDKSVPKVEEAKVDSENQLRRSTRVIKVKNDDDFLIGHGQLDLYIGKDPSEDETGAKRRRRSYYYDDLSDFSDNRRPYKKKYRGSQTIRRFLPINSVQGLLKWREEIFLNPIPEPSKDNSHLVKVKNISKESLEKHGQGIEALFINIEWNKKNQKIEDVKNLKIQSIKLMPKGLVFVWTPKDLISEIIELMEKKGFNYVENLQIAILDRERAYQIYKKKKGIIQKNVQVNVKQCKKKQSKKSEKELETSQETESFPFWEVVSSLQNIDPCSLIHTSPSEYFNKSKRTLFIFRRNTEQKVQLRHQRTCDVVFDMPANPAGKCQLELKTYLFTMIETMLPKCLQFGDRLKMMELWGDSNMRRRGWATIVEQ